MVLCLPMVIPPQAPQPLPTQEGTVLLAVSLGHPATVHLLGELTVMKWAPG